MSDRERMLDIKVTAMQYLKRNDSIEENRPLLHKRSKRGPSQTFVGSTKANC